MIAASLSFCARTEHCGLVHKDDGEERRVLKFLD